MLAQISGKQTKCKIETIAKFNDSSCSHEIEKSPEELSMISQLNGLIVSGECQNIDPMFKDELKLKVDCQSASSIRLQYFNLFENDKSCNLNTMVPAELI